MSDVEPQDELTGAPEHGEASDVVARAGSNPTGGPDPATAELDALQAVGDLTGQMLGPYRVAARVGGGVMAAVYRAIDQTTGRPVALKVLLPGADRVTRERFRREAQLVSALQHPNIVQSLHVGQISAHGSIYLAMELVEGPTLAEVLEQAGRLDPLEACRLLAPVARALDFAHQHDVVHRDVKPGNILLRRAAPGDDTGVRLTVLPEPVTPLLTDFGIARALDAPELTSVGRTLGTPAFMAPEQCAGDAEIDGRADVYALGAVLYRCLVGRPPFGGTTTQILHAHVYDPLLIPEDDAIRVPPAVLGALARAMMKEPGQRYATAGLLARELEAVASHIDPADADDAALNEATMTMASLPVTTTQITRVLVPAPPATPSRGVPVVPPPALPGAGRVTPRLPVVQRRPTPPRKTPLNQAGVLILGSALGLLLVLLVATIVMNMIPERPAAPTVPAAAVVASPTAPVGTPPAPTTSAAAGDVATGVQTPPPPTPTPGPTATPTVAPTPAVYLPTTWQEAQDFYTEHDWPSALDKLILVRRVDKNFERVRVEQMMVTSYVSLAADAVVGRQWKAATDYLEDALKIQADARNLIALRDALKTMTTVTPEDRPAAELSLQEALVAQAESIAADEPCPAAAQMNAALSVSFSEELRVRRDELRDLCTQADDAAALAEIGGAIIYSAQENGVYRIFRLAVGSDLPSTLLVDNATQPRVSPDGRTLAYYNRKPGEIGLFGASLGTTTVGQGVQLTDYSEDSADAPPSWNPQGNRLVYTSSNAGDGRYALYMVSADGSRKAADLGNGKDPAWNPLADQIVFNGFGEGNRTGLWIMRASGEDRRQLTDNGNDQRPTWTPDGTEVVFMSKRSDDNWEVYRIDANGGPITRLTTDPAQDGLPTVSPDGKYVAFMSDRGGAWRLWYVPIEGGEARLLSDIAGRLPSWLEYAIQWVN